MNNISNLRLFLLWELSLLALLAMARAWPSAMRRFLILGWSRSHREVFLTGCGLTEFSSLILGSVTGSPFSFSKPLSVSPLSSNRFVFVGGDDSSTVACCCMIRILSIGSRDSFVVVDVNDSVNLKCAATSKTTTGSLNMRQI